MKKFKIKLARHGNCVLMKCVSIDESIRGRNLLFKSSNGIKISSCSRPDLDDSTIWLAGTNTTQDNALCKIVCGNASVAGKLLKKYKFALEEYKKKIEAGEFK